MKRRFIGLLALLFVSVFIFAACVNAGTETTPTSTVETGLNEKMTYEQITPSEAKILMDTESNYIILDVRTEEEFNEGHIAGAVLIPDYEINSKAQSILTDKGQLILVYCRSGRRSKLASEALVALGYTNVKEFGGIIDWQYGTVTE